MNANRPHVVVLAGGEGSRLAQLTRALYGSDLPKQFAVLAGERSLLQTTIDRALKLTSPDRVSVVVTTHHENIARTQLVPYPSVELVVQPKNLDTAPGMLLPLVRILTRVPDASVVFLPSDHYISNAEPILDGLRAACRGVFGDRLALIGVAPTGPEVEYGWIVPSARIAAHAFEVARFEEKPEAAVAETLWQDGGLWNTFIQAGPANLFWDLARRHLPLHTAALERYAVEIDTLGEDEALAAAYRTMLAANFSREVLAHARELAVLPVSNTGWSDWGSPKRVFASLAGTPCHDRLVARIRGELAFAS